MTEMKKYHSIVRLGHKSTHDVLKEGDKIIVQEKIDGANASFRKDGDIIRAFSRNKELNEENNLGGFYQWVQENIDIDQLVEEGIYFGEWTNPHKVKYPEYQKKFFLFDIFDTETSRYIDFKLVKNQSELLNVNLVPVFYEGEYKSFEHLEQFIGQTFLGGQLGDKKTGEGVVVKNIDYRDRFGEQLFVKLVAPEFREVQKQKAPKNPIRVETEEQKFIKTVITEARVEKILYKLVDEGKLDPRFGIEDMGNVLKIGSGLILDDVLNEESDLLPEDYEIKDVKKSLGKYFPQVVKQVINNQEKLSLV